MTVLASRLGGGGLNSKVDNGDTGGFLGAVTGGFLETPGGSLYSAVGDLRNGCDDEDEGEGVDEVDSGPRHDLDLACFCVGDGGEGVTEPLPE